MYEASGRSKNIRKGLVTNQITLFYKIKPGKGELELLIFWDNRQNPKSLPY